MSEEFNFEDRYIVIKRTDVERFWRDDVRDQFMAALGRLNEHNVRIPQRQYLVIESDWPEFYPAFQMIESRVNGKPTELEVLRAQPASTEQARRSFFDLSQDLEKRLAERDALLKRSEDFVKFVHKCVRKNGEYAPLHWQEMVELDRDLSARAEPAKAKTCIECDQPYCHGVCVERGDQDYDRDQAAKGGDDE